MPNGHDFMEDFVQSYFRGLAQKEQARQFDIEQAYNKTRLDQELQLHKETMAQRGKEYVNETAFKSAQLAMQKQRAELDVKRNDREEKNQIRDDLERFTSPTHGGFFMNKPEDQTGQYTIGGDTPINPSFMNAPDPTVGPSKAYMTPEASIMNTMPQIPVANPTTTIPYKIPAEFQLPNENVANPVPQMEGQPPGTIAMRKTGQQLAYEKAQAAYDVKHEEDIDTPPILEEWLGVKLGPKIPRADAIRIGEARVKDLETRANNLVNQGLHQQANDIRREANADRKILGLLAKQNQNGGVANLSAKVDAILADPIGSGQSFKYLSQKSKEEAMLEFPKRGLGIPRPLSQQTINQQAAAYQLLSYGDKVLDFVKDPDLMQFYGTVDGRKALLGLEKIGDLPIRDMKRPDGTILKASELKRKAANAQGDFNTFMVMETRAALPGGRVLQSVLDRMGNSTVRMSTAQEIMEGHIRATKDNARAVLEGIEDGVGSGWKDRPSFQRQLAERIKDIKLVKNFPAAEMDKMPENQIVNIQGHKFIKKRGLNVGGNLETGGAIISNSDKFDVYQVD